LWENVGENFVSKIVRPISRSKIASIFSLLPYPEISSQRQYIEQALKNELNTHFSEKGLFCEGILLSEVRPVSANNPAPVSPNPSLNSADST
jgi:hypothetical protein